MVQKAKILLVDDRPENLLALEAILSALDQTLVRASSGEEALKALLTDDFAVILLDVQMPGMDGFETAAHIKRRERTRDIPIIFLTAINHGPHHTFRGYAAGAVDYISKPFDPWVLRAKVSVFVELYMKNCQLQGAGRAAADSSWRERARTEGADRAAGRAVRAARGGRGAGRSALQAAGRRLRGRGRRGHRRPSGAQTHRSAPGAGRAGAGQRRRLRRFPHRTDADPELRRAVAARTSPGGLPRAQRALTPRQFPRQRRATRTGEAVGTRVPGRSHR